jgi:hypothetical protein
MAESDVLDFKRDQYPLAAATEDQESELVKDVVAFANAWKALGGPSMAISSSSGHRRSPP